MVHMEVTRRQFLGVCALSLGAWGCSARPAQPPAAFLTWGKHGLRDGEFKKPRAINATADEVCVIDRTGRVQVFQHDGTFQRGWRMPDAVNGTPTGMTFTGDGNVLIPDTHYSQIIEYTPDGTIVERWGSYGAGEDEFIYPTDIAIGPDGALYISEYGGDSEHGGDAERVHVFDSDHSFLREWGQHGEKTGEFNRAMAIQVDARGDVYVCDTANHRIQRFTAGGLFRGVIGEAGSEPGELKYPYDFVLAPDGSMLVCEYGNNRISRFSADGSFVASLGGPGRDPGRFNSPRGITVSPDGLVFVADTDNHRVQRFPLEDFG
jgi:DNA-binding beta-propeller fold protein YncE